MQIKLNQWKEYFNKAGGNTKQTIILLVYPDPSDYRSCQYFWNCMRFAVDVIIVKNNVSEKIKTA